MILDRGYFAPVPPHDPGALRQRAAPRLQRRARRAAGELPGGRLPLRSRTATGVRVIGEPDLPNVQIASRIARSRRSRARDWRRGLKDDVRARTASSRTVTFTGTYRGRLRREELAARRSRRRPLRRVGAALGLERGRRRAARQGARRARRRRRPALFYRHESEPLANLVRDTNKFSNNVMARHIYLALSAERGTGPAGEAKASAAHRARVAAREGHRGARSSSIENGSGLSRSDRASAETIAALLRSAWASAVMPELRFLAAGVRRRRHAQDAPRRRGAGRRTSRAARSPACRAWPATCSTRAGRRWIVVMIVNHADANAAQPAIDALVEWVYRLPTRGTPR